MGQMIEFSLATRQAVPLCPFYVRHLTARDVECDVGIKRFRMLEGVKAVLRLRCKDSDF